jgi:hypothetical protein
MQVQIKTFRAILSKELFIQDTPGIVYSRYTRHCLFKIHPVLFIQDTPGIVYSRYTRYSHGAYEKNHLLGQYESDQ